MQIRNGRCNESRTAAYDSAPESYPYHRGHTVVGDVFDAGSHNRAQNVAGFIFLNPLGSDDRKECGAS